MSEETEQAVKSKSKKKAAMEQKKAKRYTTEEKKNLLARYNAYRKAGDNVKDASGKVGVPYITLHIWETKGKKKKSVKKTARQTVKSSSRKKTAKKKTQNPNKKKILKKAVTPRTGRPKKAPKTHQSKGLTLVTPRGYRIEGISPSDLIKVLKALN